MFLCVLGLVPVFVVWGSDICLAFVGKVRPWFPRIGKDREKLFITTFIGRLLQRLFTFFVRLACFSLFGLFLGVWYLFALVWLWLAALRVCGLSMRVRAFTCCAPVHLSVARPCIYLLRVRAFVRCASAHLSIARSRNRHQYSATAVSILLGTYMPFPAAVCAALGWEGVFGSLAINKSAFSLFSNRKTLLLCADVRQS